MSELRQKLTTAFKAMRKSKLVARQSYMCCSGCALSAVSDESHPGKLGFVFYHQQDTECRDKSGHVNVRFASFMPMSCAEDRETALIGQLAALHLRCAGLNVEWDGSPCQVMRVTA